MDSQQFPNPSGSPGNPWFTRFTRKSSPERGPHSPFYPRPITCLSNLGHSPPPRRQNHQPRPNRRPNPGDNKNAAQRETPTMNQGQNASRNPEAPDTHPPRKTTRTMTAAVTILLLLAAALACQQEPLPSTPPDEQSRLVKALFDCLSGPPRHQGGIHRRSPGHRHTDRHDR